MTSKTGQKRTESGRTDKLLANSTEIRQPFGNHSAEVSNSQLDLHQEPTFVLGRASDVSLPPPDLEDTVNAQPKHESMFAVVDVDGLEENDFADVGMDMSKTPDDVNQILRTIRGVVLFEGYDDDELQTVTDYMYNRTVLSGETIIHRGDAGDAFYVVKRGRFQCRVANDNSSTEMTLCEYSNEGYFGELALVNQRPRAASVIALSDGALWVLNAFRYAWLKQRRAILNADSFEQMIKSIPMFCSHLSPSLVNRLIDSIEMVNAEPGEVLCHQGEPGDAMFFIVRGEVEAVIGGRQVKRVGQNQFFGERALILSENRAATCRALVKTRLAKLSQESFGLIIPDEVVERMRQNIAEYDRLATSDDGASNDDVTDENLSTASVYIEYFCQELRK